MSVKDSIRRNEGYSYHPYLDTEGFWTIGYGHNIHHMRLSDWHSMQLGELLDRLSRIALHESWLDEDIAKATQAAEAFTTHYADLSEARQEVLIEMAFQLGKAGLNRFVRLKAALEGGHWVQAANEIFPDSLLAKQTPNRARFYADKLLAG